MKTVVFSLGGSVIIPDEVNFNFLKKFRKMIRKNYSKYRFVIVCGGGSIARKYISALKQAHRTKKQISLAGIRATRMNALFLMQFFGNEANDILPLNMKSVKDNLHKNKIVICGALRFSDSSTSDGTAAKIASLLKSEFVNITNVAGLYSSDPKVNKNAYLIYEISHKKFNSMLEKTKFEAGQHFILDQQAAKIIYKNNIKTFIVGPDVKNINKLLKNKKFLGTTIKK